MDQRSIKPGLAAVQGTGIFHPTMTHPKTGLPLEALYVDKHGRVHWPILGASEDDDSNSDGDDDGDSDDNDDNDGDNSDDDDDDDDKDPKKKIAALEEEKTRHYNRRKKAEKERDALKAELEELKAKAGKKAKKAKAEDDSDDDDDDDEQETAAQRRQREEDETERRKLKIENAFLRTNTIEWHNPGQVMTLLLGDDDYEVEFDDRGNIDRKSLAAELKRFAKANPHLVKPKKKSSDDTDSDDKGNDSKSSGSAMNGQRKGKGKDSTPTRDALAKKYPALRR